MEREMALTRDEITAGATYTVRFGHGLSDKRFHDAVSLVKNIDGMRETHVYDPGHPDANATTGYRRNDDPATASAKYDGAAKTWTVTIPASGGRPLSDLQNAAHAYDAVVERADDDDTEGKTAATYTAEVGTENAAWLTSGNGPLAGNAYSIKDNGDGTVTLDESAFTALERLPEAQDGFIEYGGEGLSRMWIEGDAFPVRTA